MADPRHSRYRYQRPTRRDRSRVAEQGFTCRHCNSYVTCAPEIAGVQNRNHCPYCLWSRHMDGRTAGDRLSACRATMRPLGLTAKRSRNRYAAERGELMIVHRCTVCARIVINRIAGDDSSRTIMEVFDGSCTATADAPLETPGVELLSEPDRGFVRRRLFGAGTPALQFSAAGD